MTFDLSKHLGRKLRSYELPIPAHVDLTRVGDPTYFQTSAEYNENIGAAEDWKRKHNIDNRWDDDDAEVIAAIIDDQVDFNEDPDLGGKLSLFPKSIGNLLNLLVWIFINLRVLSTLVLTIDMHYLMHIFTPLFWVDENGNHPGPYTKIPSSEVGVKWFVNELAVIHVVEKKPEMSWRQYRKNVPIYRANLEAIAKAYCEKIEQGYNYPAPIGYREGTQLEIWPIHVRTASRGMTLVSSLLQAVDFFDVSRWSKSVWRIKGARHPMSEEYSPFGNLATEVEYIDSTGQKKKIVIGDLSDEVIRDLLNCDMFVIAGQALSHCVLSAIYDIMRYILEYEQQRGIPLSQSLARKVYILADCSSPVPLPEYEARAQRALDDFRSVGMHVIDSKTPLEDLDLPPKVAAKIARLKKAA